MMTQELDPKVQTLLNAVKEIDSLWGTESDAWKAVRKASAAFEPEPEREYVLPEKPVEGWDHFCGQISGSIGAKAMKITREQMADVIRLLRHIPVMKPPGEQWNSIFALITIGHAIASGEMVIVPAPKLSDEILANLEAAGEYP